jgi:hypothetical protein
VTTYRGWHISEVCCDPYAYQYDGDERRTITPPRYTGMAGLVDAIDRHMRAESIAACNAILEAREAAIRSGDWDVVNSRHVRATTE